LTQTESRSKAAATIIQLPHSVTGSQAPPAVDATVRPGELGLKGSRGFDMFRDALALCKQDPVELHDVIAGLESFNRSVSHDLRSPLATIVSLSQLADRALRNDDGVVARRTLGLIASQAEDCLKMIHSLLRLASVRREELAVTEIDVAALVGEVTQQLLLADPQMPAISMQLQPRLTVAADEGLLRPVLLNLIGNAVKFTRDRLNPRIDVGGFDDAAGVTLFVRDNGVGFDAAAMEQLFEPFVRLHGAHYEGHGIGLSIVRCAVERHGGCVWATSVADEGACFYFTIPRLCAAGTSTHFARKEASPHPYTVTT